MGINVIIHDYNDDMSNVNSEIRTYFAELKNTPKVLRDEGSQGKSEKTFEEKLTDAKNETTQYGDIIVDDLMRLMLDDSLSSELADTIIEKVKDNKFLSDTHFFQIAQICMWKKLYSIARAILEEGRIRYPNFDDLTVLLIDNYCKIGTREYRDEAIVMMEKFFHIELCKNKDKTVKRFTKASIEKRISMRGRLATIFDAYLVNDEFHSILSLIESYEELLSKQNEKLVLSNKAFALKHIGQDDAAIKIFEEILRNDPNEETLAQLGLSFFSKDKREKGYKVFEWLALNNYRHSGSMALIKLAKKIHEYNICRTENGIEKILVPYHMKQVVIPILFKAVELDYYNSDVIGEVKQELFRLGARDEFNFFIEQSHAYPEIFEDFKNKYKGYNFEIINYIDKNAVTDIHSVYQGTKDFINEILADETRKVSYD